MRAITFRSIGLGVISLCLPVMVAAHGGGLDASGCHTNRKTGEYHCHRAQVKPANAQPKPETPERNNATPLKPTSSPGAPICHTGPRGGRYTITPSGKKNYKGC